jgi:hypothetical protein
MSESFISDMEAKERDKDEQSEIEHESLFAQ